MNRKLYVGNLAATATDDDLQSLFGRFGEVAAATVVINPGTGKSRCFAFVEMAAGAEAAITGTNGKRFQGRPIAVNEIAMPPAKPVIA